MTNEKLKTITDKPLDERSNQELEISRILLQRQSNNYLKGIDNNLKFFFWVFMISVFVTVLYFLLEA